MMPSKRIVNAGMMLSDVEELEDRSPNSVNRASSDVDMWSTSVLSQRRILGDSTSIPANPPPKNMIDIDTCSKSCAVHAPPHAARCSRKTFVQPYSQMTKDSVNSAVGMRRFHPAEESLGLQFQAQPRSANEPDHRPRVKSPYQKKIPPLTKCARPLKILLLRYRHGQQVCPRRVDLVLRKYQRMSPTQLLGQ